MVELDLFIICIAIDILSIVFGTTANSFESVETRSSGSVCVDINYFAAFYILEKSHCCVASIILHHIGILLAYPGIESRVLENASLSISALGWMLQKVLANRSQILPAETFLFLELILTMRKSTSLIFLTVFTSLSIEPETAKFSFDLLLPASLASGVFSRRSSSLVLSLLLNRRFESCQTFVFGRVLAVKRISNCTIGHGRR